MANNTKVRMPKGIRNKLMAALCMLLVSTIMLVSATYAWFTLSTAPEVTGISTSVGANGNLEIALVTEATYENLNINSGVGDSYETLNQTVVEANKTWGNIVKLDDASYGFADIKLNQAKLNMSEADATKINVANPLATATYGSDGRVKTVEGLASAVKNATSGTFKYDSTAQTYGVRAIGVPGNQTPQQSVYDRAAAQVNSNKSGATSGIKNVINGSQLVFLPMLTKLEGGSVSFTAQELDIVKQLADSMETSLNSITLVYGNAGLAKAASDGLDEAVLDALKALITTDAAAVKTALNEKEIGTVDTELTAIATAQSKVADVQDALDALTEQSTYDSAADVTVIKDAIKDLCGEDFVAYDADDQEITSRDSATLMANAKKVYLNDANCVLKTVCSFTGTFKISDSPILGMVDLYAGAPNTPANWPTLATRPEGAAESNIAADDTYGFILDFAFRTNAADSSLQIQTNAVNRVYNDEQGNDDSLATMGHGSTVTFTYSEATTSTIATGLLNRIKIVFFNPTDGTIYANGKLTGVSAGSGSATANITLDKPAGTAEDELDDIVLLQQNQATRVSVLVYLDGENITNAEVANAASSGDLDLNLQFSSSATLVPMENSALRTMTNS